MAPVSHALVFGWFHFCVLVHVEFRDMHGIHMVHNRTLKEFHRVLQIRVSKLSHLGPWASQVLDMSLTV